MWFNGVEVEDLRLVSIMLMVDLFEGWRGGLDGGLYDDEADGFFNDEWWNRGGEFVDMMLMVRG